MGAWERSCALALVGLSGACWSPELGTTARVLPPGHVQGQVALNLGHYVSTVAEGQTRSYPTFPMIAGALRIGVVRHLEVGARLFPAPGFDVKYAPFQFKSVAIGVLVLGQVQTQQNPDAREGFGGWVHVPVLVTFDLHPKVQWTFNAGPSLALGIVVADNFSFGGPIPYPNAPKARDFNGGLGRLGAGLTFHADGGSYTTEVVYLRSHDANVQLVGGSFTWSFGATAGPPKHAPAAPTSPLDETPYQSLP